MCETSVCSPPGFSVLWQCISTTTTVGSANCCQSRLFSLKRNRTKVTKLPSSNTCQFSANLRQNDTFVTHLYPEAETAHVEDACARNHVPFSDTEALVRTCLCWRLARTTAGRTTRPVQASRTDRTDQTGLRLPGPAG